MPESRGGALWRFALAAVVVVLFAATTTAVAGLLQFKQLAQDLSFTKPLSNARITVADTGTPQTLLLIGSDHRAGDPWNKANTDTMMLVRLDPKSSTINVLSIPRDLHVSLPRHPNVDMPDKINAAYSIGGPNLLVKVLQTQVFPGIAINHIIDVNFSGFRALVNAIGCVYADVDRRYFHVSAPDPADDWSSIDIQPGYQKLCGADALAFVRFRHYDTDLVRNSRQQDFLRWAKSQYSTSSLLAQRDRLISIFGHYTVTDADLQSIDGLIKLFDLVAFSAGHTVKQVSFPATEDPCNPICYLSATRSHEVAAYQAFITPTVARPASRSSTSRPPAKKPAPRPSPPAVTNDIADTRSQAHALGNVAMPVYAPASIANGSTYCVPGTCEDGLAGDGSYPRRYTITDRSGNPHPAYRLTIVLDEAGGQFYGVQGTTWQSPPILNETHQTQVVNGKTLELFHNGQKITMVAWHGPHGVYWVSNTLSDGLSNAQIVAIAGSLTLAG